MNKQKEGHKNESNSNGGQNGKQKYNERALSIC